LHDWSRKTVLSGPAVPSNCAQVNHDFHEATCHRSSSLVRLTWVSKATSADCFRRFRDFFPRQCRWSPHPVTRTCTARWPPRHAAFADYRLMIIIYSSNSTFMFTFTWSQQVLLELQLKVIQALNPRESQLLVSYPLCLFWSVYNILSRPISYTVWVKKLPLQFSAIFSQTVGNF